MPRSSHKCAHSMLVSPAPYFFLRIHLQASKVLQPWLSPIPRKISQGTTVDDFLFWPMENCERDWKEESRQPERKCVPKIIV